MKSREQILERLCFHLARSAPEGTPVHRDTDLVQDLGLDSMKVMDLIMEIEDEFDVSIPLNVLMDVRTPAQLAQAIAALLESADGAVR